MIAIFKRELYNYFCTKTSLIFAICFIFIANFLAFYMGKVIDSDKASLVPFFIFHPWLYCFLLPAISMSLFTEEIKKGSIDILFSLPVSSFAIIFGKFLAAWVFIGICLIGTMTIWITINILGSPDNLMILSGYFASFMLAGCFLVIGINISTIANNSTIAFILTATINMLIIFISSIGNLSFVLSFLPDIFINIINDTDLITAFINMTKGIITGSSIILFISFIATGIIINISLLEGRKR